MNDSQTHDFVKALNQYFQSIIRLPRVRMGEQQEVETLISEETLLFAMFLRNEKKDWLPRIEIAGYFISVKIADKCRKENVGGRVK